jgi:hypothetical protein
MVQAVEDHLHATLLALLVPSTLISAFLVLQASQFQEQFVNQN